MSNALAILLVVAIWIVLNKFLLPKIGIRG